MEVRLWAYRQGVSITLSCRTAYTALQAGCYDLRYWLDTATHYLPPVPPQPGYNGLTICDSRQHGTFNAGARSLVLLLERFAWTLMLPHLPIRTCSCAAEIGTSSDLAWNKRSVGGDFDASPEEGDYHKTSATPATNHAGAARRGLLMIGVARKSWEGVQRIDFISTPVQPPRRHRPCRRHSGLARSGSTRHPADDGGCLAPASYMGPVQTTGSRQPSIILSRSRRELGSSAAERFGESVFGSAGC